MHQRADDAAKRRRRELQRGRREERQAADEAIELEGALLNSASRCMNLYRTHAATQQQEEPEE